MRAPGAYGIETEGHDNREHVERHNHPHAAAHLDEESIYTKAFVKTYVCMHIFVLAFACAEPWSFQYGCVRFFCIQMANQILHYYWHALV